MDNIIIGYDVKKFNTPTKRYCQTLDLKTIQNSLPHTANYILKKVFGKKFYKE